MENFWKWLMRANARGVFMCSLLALIMVAGWWAWRQSLPVGEDVLMPPGSSRNGDKAGLALLAFVQDQLAVVGRPATKNPFLLARSKRSPKPRGGTPQETPAEEPPEIAWVETKPETPDKPATPAQPDQPATPEKPKPKPPPPKPAERVNLTYRGVFRRPDGQYLALIEDSKSKSSAFYLSGAELFGTKVKGIATEDLEIEDAGGAAVSLHLGEAHVFEDGVHAD